MRILRIQADSVLQDANLVRRSLQINVVNLSVKYRFVIAKAKPEAIHSVCLNWIASLRSH
jgi:hypothetical protein